MRNAAFTLNSDKLSPVQVLRSSSKVSNSVCVRARVFVCVCACMHVCVCVCYRGGDLAEAQQREHKVGQYNVKLNAFEQTALPVLRIPVSFYMPGKDM